MATLLNCRFKNIRETIRLRTRRGAQVLKTVLLLTLYGVVAAGNAVLNEWLGCGHGEWTKAAGVPGDQGPKHPCSVCHFLSQVQVSDERPREERAEIVRKAETDEFPIAFQADGRVRGLSRVPPLPV